ncbi:uncharacterized protein LOC113511245 [Galleria mellonella]|uniref:Uncharacterized protein LOC113511245 n=1 Tax=Galleria mellonella TaxID=7137 RepID=A0A6J1WBC5_GALME|nr:uncharacterized protein LOC113511245 [Galleria mellonella]
MKVLLLVLIVYLNNATCDKKYFQPESKIIMKHYPKKVIRELSPNIHILNSKKYINTNLEGFKLNRINTKKNDEKNKGYTVFQNTGLAQSDFGIPDSPYFPFSENIEMKPRIKKVLPEYIFSALRKKRSASFKLNLSNKESENEGKSKEIKTNKKVEKKRKPENTNDKSKLGHVDIKVDNKIRKNNVTDHTTTDVSKPTNDSNVPAQSNTKIVKTKTTNTKNKSKQQNKGSQTKSIKKKAKLKSSKNSKNATKRPVKLKYTIRRPAKKEIKDKKGKVNVKGPGQHEKKVLRSRRLVAGRDALIEEYPYVVSIQKGGEHWCAGALLNPRLVITTANCIWKSSRVSRLRVRAGSRYVEQGGQVAKIKEVMKHPRWSIRKAPDNDVALILLDRNIRFSDAVHGVDLPNRIMMPAFEDAWVTSWGSERRDGIYDKKDMTLQVYHARLMDRDKCNNVTQRFGVTVTENFICLSQTGRQAPCTRDTGAPAVSDGVIWGLASWGIRKLCGTERYPAVFSYLASNSNMDFILNATRLLMADERFYPFPDHYPYVPATTSVATTTAFSF